MTIKYKNKRGVEFTVDVFIKVGKVECCIKVTATKDAYVSTSSFIIPYGYLEVIIPFDFNGTEQEITNAIKAVFHTTKHRDIRAEELVDAMDIVMSENENLIGMQIIEPHRITSKTSV
ncbi:BC1 [Chayote yellow mosaic Benin betasatellite]|uniref:BC1 n=1 Tax=Chayote yellow mosaic Benin betasatellite TaxID=1736759 RepID=A0A191KVK0_9VIRU|nr:BC1 [Chayote yellow mosaic Benin betasatellite]ALO02612.1 BC1 [Chayote yellow mosaic Benin betasatellite]